MDDLEGAAVEARDLTRMLILIAENARAQFASAVAPFDLAPNMARALMWLPEPTPMKELADALACDPSYVTSLADQLENRGLLMRVPGTDRRVKLLQLTPQGLALRRDVAAAVQKEVGFALRLSSAERATLHHLLTRLLEDLPVAALTVGPKRLLTSS